MFAYGYRRRQRNLFLDYTKLKPCQNHSTATSWAEISGGLLFGEPILTPFLLYIVSRSEFHVCLLARAKGCCLPWPRLLYVWISVMWKVLFQWRSIYQAISLC